MPEPPTVVVPLDGSPRAESAVDAAAARAKALGAVLLLRRVEPVSEALADDSDEALREFVQRIKSSRCFAADDLSDLAADVRERYPDVIVRTESLQAIRPARDTP